jgi:hypothetical protein
LNEGREGFYGWCGLGGAVLEYHPEEKIGFGYATTNLYFPDVSN